MQDFAANMSPLRRALFPIFNWELKKFIPMALIVFMTIFNFTMLRTMKDAFVVPKTSAETLAYLKFFLVLPMSILGSLLYIKVRTSTSFEKTYYIVVSVFLTYFALFWLFLYPYHQDLHMSDASIASWAESFPVFRFVIPIIGKWVYASYYAFAELWGSFCLSVLFWQFANDSCGPHESKRFYPLFVLCGNLANFVLSYFTKYLAKVGAMFGEAVMIDHVCEMTLFMGILMCLVFRWLNTKVMTDKRYTQDVIVRKKKKKKLSFKDSMKHLAASKYVGFIAVLILSYGIMTNLIEQTWKAELKLQYPTTMEYMGFMSDYQWYLSVAAIVFVYISKGILNRYGWRSCALVTPICLATTGIVFFSYLIFEEQLSFIVTGLMIDPILFAASFGAIGVLLSKSSKYSFFDPTKEMAFIPLEDDLRVSGKAAADGVGARLGKSGGGLIQIGLFSVFTSASQHDIAPILAVMVVILGIVWLTSVFRLDVLYRKKVAEAEAETDAAHSAEKA